MALVDGQIYRWRWADEAKDADRGPYRSYHCKSCIAIVRNGLLIDTYWYAPGAENAIDPSKVVLTLWADESWPKISQYQAPYYKADDVADTRHANNSSAPIYLRPGAERDAETTLAMIAHREETARSQIRTAEWALENYAAARKLVAEGKINEVML
jgi:hypothetical protein